MRRLRLVSEAEAKALENVLSDFFFRADGWRHKRIDQDIIEYHAMAEKNKANGKLGGRPKKTQSVSVGMPSGNPNESQNNPNQEPITNNQSKPKVKTTVTLKRDDDVLQIFDHWKSTLGHDRAKLDQKRSKQITSALALGYSVEDLCNAITGCSLSPFHMGDNEKGQRYDTLDLILRNAEKIDQFIGFYRNPPKPINGKTQRQIDSEATTRAIFGNMLTPIERVISGEVVK